jgi:hypothetical protein
MKSETKPRYFALFALILSLATSASRAEIPRPEHPRPDFQRPVWLNLNGQWQWENDTKNDGVVRGLISGKDLAEKIVVPFCPESKLSGLALATEYMPHTWYRRSFQIPAEMRGQPILSGTLG